MDSSLLEQGVWTRLRQLSGYTWDDSREPFHSSYGAWHVFGTKHIRRSISSSTATTPASSNSARSYYEANDSDSKQPDDFFTFTESQDVESIHLAIVARISRNVLREERAYHTWKSLAKADPNSEHTGIPLERIRFPSQDSEGSISVCIFESPGLNYLSKFIDYGPGRLGLRGDDLSAYRDTSFVPKPMPLQAFLDFAIGAAECIELLHSLQIVHGEIRADAFHMNLETGKVTLVNLGTGRLKTFEQGFTSIGWERMSKELGSMAKLSFMSPEQTGRMPFEPDSRTDIFSLGIVLWTILSRKPAFGGETPMEVIQAVLGKRLPSVSDIRPDIPDVVGRIIHKATAKTVSERYHSVSGLRHDLMEVRRILGTDDSSQLLKLEVGTKDVSQSFILAQTMVGRSREHDKVVHVIERASKLHQSQRRQKKGTSQLSRLSEDQLSNIDSPAEHENVYLEHDSINSIDGRSSRRQIIYTRINLVLIAAYRPEGVVSDKLQKILNTQESQGSYFGTLINRFTTDQKLGTRTIEGALGVTHVSLKPFNEMETIEYVAATLRRSKVDASPLGAIIHSRTGGNPFYVKESLNNFHCNKAIWYDFRYGGWMFNLSSILEQVNGDKSTGIPEEELVLSRINHLPLFSRSILAWASMLGSSFSFQLLERLSSSEFAPIELSLSEHDAMIGLHAALQTFIIVPTEDDDVFRFSHGRYTKAAASLNKDYEDQMHFVVAHVLSSLYLLENKYRSIAVSSMCQSINTIKSSMAIRKQFRDMASEYAQIACESGVRSTAVKAYAACIALLQDNPWDSDAEDVSYDETLQIYTGAAECYLYCRRYAEAKQLIASVISNANTAVDKVSCWVLQSRTFSQEGDSAGAFLSLKQCLVALEIEVDPDPTFDKCDAEFKRLCEVLQASEATDIVWHPMAEDEGSLNAVGAVLLEACSAAFWSDTLMIYQMILTMVNTYLVSGSFPQSGMGFLLLGVVAVTRHNMVNFASDCGNIALELFDRWKDPYTVGRGGAIYSMFLGHIQNSLHASLNQVEGTLEYAIQAGDRRSIILNYGFVASLRFFVSENLAELDNFCTYACQDIPDWQMDTPGGSMVLAIRQVSRALQGKTHTEDSMGVMTDEQHSSPGYKSWLMNNVKNWDRPLMLYETMEIAPLFLYGHFPSAVALGNSALKKIAAIWSARNTRFLMFFHALSLAGAILPRIEEQRKPEYRKQSPQLSSDINGRSLESALQDEISGTTTIMKYFKRRIEQWQAVTNVNYLAWSEILAAQIAEIEDDYPTILQHYEAAIDHASTNGFYFEEALANSLLGEHLARMGSRRLARMALREAVSLYRRIDATGVANHLERKHHDIFQAPPTHHATAEVGVQTDYEEYPDLLGPHPGDFGDDGPPHHTMEKQDLVVDKVGMWREGSALADMGAGPALHILDLTSILESSQVISSVLQVDQLLKTMCEIILQNCKGVASLAAIVIEDGSAGWGVAASGFAEEGAQAHNPILPLGNSSLVVESVVNYCSRFRDRVFLPDLMQDQQFSNVNKHWAARNPESKSVVAIPITHGDGENPLLGVVYLEGLPNAFTNRNLEVLQLLVNQIGISYFNSLTLKEVERISSLNKSMVEIQKKALAEAIAAKDSADAARKEAFRSAKAAEEAAKLAEEAAKAKATFLANISHELRTPLNGVIGNSELLLLDNQLQEHHAEMADSIRVSANLLLSLINDILDFSKIEAHQMQLHLTSFYVHEMVQEMVRSIPAARKQLKVPAVQIIQDIDLPSSLVYGDPVRLHQILGNLVSNSLKFTKKGSITIGAKAEWETESATHLSFWIEDTGIGIPAEQIHKLFKPFSQADTSTSRKYGGSGLGLSICKSLVESMGGSIKLKSTENVGTLVSFSLTLPKANSASDYDILHSLRSRSVSSAKGPAGHLDFSGLPPSDVRVCIAEDNLVNQKVALQFLKKLSFKGVDTYSNGLEAVEGIRKMTNEGRPYHMILMDVQMPVLDGYEATKLLRKDSDEAVRGILVIALTASAIEGDREKCLASGMNDYLAKPVRLALLKKKFGEYMQIQ
ncbi:hypothetical protein DL98DRAFT_462380 [Cadophora sp. DSE1049]|nr:hypothetical protein DL98DRAFT_462380 [Cadophora sp. DSE1049]